MFKFPQARVLLFTKEPVKGKVKTRLISAVGAEKAYQLHCSMLQYQASKLQRAALAPWELWVSGNIDNPLLKQLASDIDRFPQQGSDLGQRMQHAAESALRRSASVVLIGTDCPSIDSQYLENALTQLYQGRDAVIGPAEDGGYVLLGLRRCEESLFSGIPWGTGQVLTITLHKLAELGWEYSILPTRWDVDRVEDLRRLTALQPPLNFQLDESGKSDSN